MTDDSASLDAAIAALEIAARASDEQATQAHLEAIEHHLEAMNPLLRGMTYAHVQSVLGKPEQAAAVVQDLLELMPQTSMAHYQLGCYRRAAGDGPGALVAFTRATELEPSHVDAWIHRGRLLDEQGESPSAVEAYRHAMLLAPTEVDVWRNLGNSLAAMECFDEALEAYRTAAQLRPADETVAFLAASAHQAKGDIEAANAALTESQRVELGEVVEVRVQSRGLDLRCRFHAPSDTRQGREAAARASLMSLADDVAAAEAFPLARDGAFVVSRDDHWLWCDADPVRGAAPHRFFDATRLVENTSQ